MLRVIGKHGILVNKDFGSILTMHSDTRDQLLQDLRDIYDGHWVRTLGVDGGRTLEWTGKCGFIGASTPEIDNHHSAVSRMGDRYLLLRLNLTDSDEQARRAIQGTGDEAEMRESLQRAMAGILDHSPTILPRLNDEQVEELSQFASLVARGRSVIVRDSYTRDVVSVAIPEQPARLAKQMAQLHGGLRAIGCDPAESWRIVLRVGLDSMPPARVAILRDLQPTDQYQRTDGIADRLGLP